MSEEKLDKEIRELSADLTQYLRNRELYEYDGSDYLYAPDAIPNLLKEGHIDDIRDWLWLEEGRLEEGIEENHNDKTLRVVVKLLDRVDALKNDPEYMEMQKVTALYVCPNEYPKTIRIADNLHELQKAVQGSIEMLYPFADDVCIICNEEGKINGMALNRTLYNDTGMPTDIIAGPFLIVGVDRDNIKSLSEEQLKKYEASFHDPTITFNVWEQYRGGSSR